VVRHGETGFVVESYQELIKFLELVSDIDPERCREYVGQNFSREAMVTAYLELYRSQTERQTPMVGG
jgi:glycosyltransferase involved in cell wall biosynthesis